MSDQFPHHALPCPRTEAHTGPNAFSTSSAVLWASLRCSGDLHQSSAVRRCLWLFVCSTSSCICKHTTLVSSARVGVICQQVGVRPKGVTVQLLDLRLVLQAVNRGAYAQHFRGNGPAHPHTG